MLARGRRRAEVVAGRDLSCEKSGVIIIIIVLVKCLTHKKSFNFISYMYFRLT